MKGKLAALIAGIVLGSAGVAAASLAPFGSAYGIKCFKDTGAHAVYCGQSNGRGYMVGVSSYAAVVLNNNTGQFVFKRFQP